MVIEHHRGRTASDPTAPAPTPARLVATGAASSAGPSHDGPPLSFIAEVTLFSDLRNASFFAAAAVDGIPHWPAMVKVRVALATGRRGSLLRAFALGLTTGGYTDTTWHDATGNVLRTLTAANRARCPECGAGCGATRSRTSASR